MNRRSFLCLAFSLCLAWQASVCPVLAEAPWQAGFAKSKITPEPGLWMAGYAARDHAAEGTLHDLWIKSLALKDADGHRAVLVSMDLLGLPRSMYENVVGRLEEESRLARADVLLNASHTHSGPVLRGALYDIYPLDEEQRARIEAYSASLEDTLVRTIAESLAAMAPARLEAGVSSASFAANRRAMRAAYSQAEAPVDHTVPALTVRSPEGNLRVIVFGYACHSTTLDIYQWNGDYPGFAQLALEERFPETEAMFIAGCGADQNPHPRRSVDLCRQHGLELADAVCEAVGRPMEPVSPELATAIELIELPYGDEPDEASLREMAAGSNYAARWARRLLKEKEAGRDFATAYPAYPIQVWQLGQYRLAGLGGEVVVDYVPLLRERLGTNTWVAGYTNDVMAYIPSHRIWSEGGYEAGAFSVYGLPANGWAEDIETRILAAADRLGKQLDSP